MENGGKRIGGGNKQWRGWRIRAWVCSIGFESVGVLHDRVETLRKKERRDLGGERTRRRRSEGEGGGGGGEERTGIVGSEEGEGTSET